MTGPLILFALSLATVLGALIPGSPLGEPVLFAGALATVAALFLLLRAAVARRAQGRVPYMVVDGSNVMHWRENQPDLDSVKRVAGLLKRQGYVPVVWFDANAGYLARGRYMGPRPLARQLGLPARQVFVAPRGTPADPLILSGAEALGARVVTNDRFRDWVGSYPYLHRPGVLVQGQIAGDSVRLMLS